MQSLLDVPLRVLSLLFPLMMFVPAGQQFSLSPSSAVTLWVLVVTCPAASVAVQVTTVVFSGKVAGLLLVIVTGSPQEFDPVAVPMLALLQEVMVSAAGTLRVGGAVFFLVTFWPAVV